jgi:hypothetical protein
MRGMPLLPIVIHTCRPTCHSSQCHIPTCWSDRVLHEAVINSLMQHGVDIGQRVMPAVGDLQGPEWFFRLGFRRLGLPQSADL